MICVIIPTRNEVATIGPVLGRLSKYVMPCHTLVVDDSDDGTDLLATSLGVHVIHGNRRGLGPALLKGFQWASDHRYVWAVVMDAGGTHDSSCLDKLMKASTVDITTASRFMRVHKDYGLRTWISRTAVKLVNLLMGTRLTDVTTGYRCYKMAAVEPVLKKCDAVGFAIQIQLLCYILQNGGTVREVPTGYTLTNSSFSPWMLIEALWALWVIKVEGIYK